MLEVSKTVAAFLGSMIGVTILTWVASGVLGNQLGIKKIYVAVVLGPLTGLLAYGAGFLPTPATGWACWAFAALMGLICTAGAKVWADNGPPVITGLLKKGSNAS